MNKVVRILCFSTGLGVLGTLAWCFLGDAGGSMTTARMTARMSVNAQRQASFRSLPSTIPANIQLPNYVQLWQIADEDLGDFGVENLPPLDVDALPDDETVNDALLPSIEAEDSLVDAEDDNDSVTSLPPAEVETREGTPGDWSEVGREGKLADVIRGHWVSLSENGQLIGRISTLDDENLELNPSQNLQVNFIRQGVAMGSAETDRNGRFQISGLQPGVYSMVASGRSGFIAYSLNVLAAKDPRNATLPPAMRVFHVAQPRKRDLRTDKDGGNSTHVVSPAKEAIKTAQLGPGDGDLFEPSSPDENDVDDDPTAVRPIPEDAPLEIDATAVPPTFRVIKQLVRQYYPEVDLSEVQNAAYEEAITADRELKVPGSAADKVPFRRRGIPDDLSDELPNSRPATSVRSHRVLLQPDGRFLGRLHAIHLDTGRPKMIRQLNVFIIQDDRQIARVPVDEYGVFEVKGLDPGAYSLVAAGQDGFGAQGFELDMPAEKEVFRSPRDPFQFATYRKRTFRNVGQSPIQLVADRIPGLPFPFAMALIQDVRDLRVGLNPGANGAMAPIPMAGNMISPITAQTSAPPPPPPPPPPPASGMGGMGGSSGGFGGGGGGFGANLGPALGLAGLAAAVPAIVEAADNGEPRPLVSEFSPGGTVTEVPGTASTPPETP